MVDTKKKEIDREKRKKAQTGKVKIDTETREKQERRKLGQSIN